MNVLSAVIAISRMKRVYLDALLTELLHNCERERIEYELFQIHILFGWLCNLRSDLNTQFIQFRWNTFFFLFLALILDFIYKLWWCLFFFGNSCKTYSISIELNPNWYIGDHQKIGQFSTVKKVNLNVLTNYINWSDFWCATQKTAFINFI